LDEVLGEYMERLDRGETVDQEHLLQEHLLARYPELAEDLRSYFAGGAEVERLQRPGQREVPTASESGAQREPAEAPVAEGTAGGTDDYELLEEIGQGGMGVIYKARQLSLSRLVALKMIRADRLASLADLHRFQSEAQAVASLDHPNIVPIYEVGQLRGQPFFSMKLIEGGSLAQHQRRFARDLRAGAALLATAARAVHYAHQRGFLHRDLKPGNILLDAEGRPHVTDFGLVKRLMPRAGEASVTQQGIIVGTPNYMAPEQAASREVSTAADVYSLGAILYELLTRHPPFCAATPLETLLELLEREPPRPRSRNPRVDRDLETVCLKCLQREPGKRYASAEALAEDLERWLRREPIQARRVRRLERVVKWARRRPLLATLGTLLVVTLVAGIAGVWWQGLRAQEGYRKAVVHAEAERRTAYARTIPLAYAEWRVGNAGPAAQMLEECHQDLRGWEWHYLRRLFQARQLATLTGPEAGVRAVAFGPDGKRVAAADADGFIRVWDRRTLREVLKMRRATGAVEALAFSPRGEYLASGSSDGTVCVWDAVGGEALATLEAHSGGVTGLAFEPLPRVGAGGPRPTWRLASTGRGAADGELKLWGPGSGKAVAAKSWSNGPLTAVAYRPDGKWLATVGHDGSVEAWDAASLNHLRAFTRQTPWTGPWRSVTFSADGRWLAAGSPAGPVRVWDTTTGQEFFTVLTPTEAGVSALAFGGPEDRYLVAATADNMIQAWVRRNGRHAFALRGHTRPVKAVAASPDGRCLVSGSLDRTVKLWDISRREADLTLRPANEGVTAVAFSPDGAFLASATRDRVLKVWNVATAKPVLTVQKLPGALNGLAFDSNGYLAGACGDGTVRVWGVPSGRERLCLRGDAPVHAVAFSPGGELAAADGGGTVRVWQVPSGRERLCLRCRASLQAVAFNPRGSLLAAAGAEGAKGVVHVWRAGSAEKVHVLRQGGPAHAVAFSLNGQHLAAACQDEAVRVWDTTTGERVQLLGSHAGAVRGLAYRYGRLVSVGDDKAVRVWDMAGRELLALRGHTDKIRAVAFSPDGHRLASAGDDRTIKIWEGTPLPGQRE
jgi:WD40 repeat protein/tRNA A-37 threonylcarbamoyl transferase component Bud32